MTIKMNKWNPYTITLSVVACFISVGMGAYFFTNKTEESTGDTGDTEDTGNTFDETSADKNRQHESNTPQGSPSNIMPKVTKVSSRKQPPIGVGGGGFLKKTNKTNKTKKNKKSRKSRRNRKI